MELITWDELIKKSKNQKSIKLIGYGSLLNDNTHHNDHFHKPVIFYGFKRLYNLKFICSKNQDKEFEKLCIKLLKRYGITKQEDIQKLKDDNTCVLNCIPTGNKQDLVTGLCIEIKNEEILNYSKRECQYNLIETSFEYICPKTGKKTPTDEISYVLVAKQEGTTSSGTIFKEYHINCRNGAYNFGEYFGKMFDESTYDGKGNLVNI